MKIKQKIASKLVTELHRLGTRIHAWIERDGRGACPTCGGMLTEQKKGWYRCDHCR